MRQVTMHEAKTHLSRLIKEALAGEEIVIARGDQPLVKLVPIARAPAERHIGGAPELVVRISEDFDAPVADFGEYM